MTDYSASMDSAIADNINELLKDADGTDANAAGTEQNEEAGDGPAPDSADQSATSNGAPKKKKHRGNPERRRMRQAIKNERKRMEFLGIRPPDDMLPPHFLGRDGERPSRLWLLRYRDNLAMEFNSVQRELGAPPIPRYVFGSGMPPMPPFPPGGAGGMFGGPPMPPFMRPPMPFGGMPFSSPSGNILRSIKVDGKRVDPVTGRRVRSKNENRKAKERRKAKKEKERQQKLAEEGDEGETGETEGAPAGEAPMQNGEAGVTE